MENYQGHLILFEHAGFQGRHMHIFRTTDYVGDDFNDITSSFVILSGVWEFFFDAGRHNPTGNVNGYGPGLYPWVETEGVANDMVSSVAFLSQSPNPVD